MKTYLHILVLASSALFISTSPVSDSLTADEGSGDGPEIVINDVVEKNVDTDTDNSDVSAADPSDLVGMEMNPEENEVNDKSVDEEENKVDNKKCKKCIRGHYRSRNVDFCDSCEKKKGHKEEKLVEKKKGHKEEKLVEKKQVNLHNRCKRCARKNFKARNEEFCSDDCSSVDINKPTDKKHNKKKQNILKNKETTPATTSTTEAVTTTTGTVTTTEAVVKLVKPVDETVEQDMKKNTENDQKKNKNKRKQQKPNKKDRKKKNKNKKHSEKHKEQDEVDEIKETETVLEVEDESLIEPEDQKDTVKLGPLENLIKFLINANTFTH